MQEEDERDVSQKENRVESKARFKMIKFNKKDNTGFSECFEYAKQKMILA